MALRRAEPVTLAARLFGGDRERTLALMRAAWPRVVGPELARRTEVVAMEGATLRIGVPDARWQKVLHRMQPELVGRLRALAGELAPRRLGFVVGVVVDAGAPAPETVAAPDPVVPTPADGLVRAAGAIEDHEIRRRFLDTAFRYLARGASPRPEREKGRGHA